MKAALRYVCFRWSTPKMVDFSPHLQNLPAANKKQTRTKASDVEGSGNWKKNHLTNHYSCMRIARAISLLFPEPSTPLAFFVQEFLEKEFDFNRSFLLLSSTFHLFQWRASLTAGSRRHTQMCAVTLQRQTGVDSSFFLFIFIVLPCSAFVFHLSSFVFHLLSALKFV